jgi:hypothetical protein
MVGNPRTTCDSAPPIRESSVKPGATQSAYYKGPKDDTNYTYRLQNNAFSRSRKYQLLSQTYYW